MKTIASILGIFLACILIHSEDLRLTPDGKSIEAVNVVTNTASRDMLIQAEAQIVKEIQQAKQTIQQANAIIANDESKLADVRRYIATLDAMLKMKHEGTNVVTTPITLPATPPPESK